MGVALERHEEDREGPEEELTPRRCRGRMGLNKDDWQDGVPLIEIRGSQQRVGKMVLWL